MLSESGEVGKARAALQSCRGSPTTGRKRAAQTQVGEEHREDGARDTREQSEEEEGETAGL